MKQAILIERKTASMTDDPLHLNWVFEKSLQVITNNDINLLLAICGPKGFEKFSPEIICPHHGIPSTDGRHRLHLYGDVLHKFSANASFGAQCCRETYTQAQFNTLMHRHHQSASECDTRGNHVAGG